MCTDGFWLNREQCCWDSKNSTHDGYRNRLCKEWTQWSELFSIAKSDNGSTYFVSLLFHVLISLCFAFMAAVLVKFYAPYACGSGVPEVIYFQMIIVLFEFTILYI